jgi:hypothetical protein
MYLSAQFQSRSMFASGDRINYNVQAKEAALAAASDTASVVSLPVSVTEKTPK